jgi:MATE family multidrug resistance protein
VPLILYVLAIWGVGLGGGYVVAFDLGGFSPAWARAAQGFWAMATLGLTVAALGMTTFLAWTLRRQRRADRAVPVAGA